MDRIEVDTSLGKLSAQVCSDAMYPGIVICIEQTDEDGKYDKQLALVECTPDHPVAGASALRLLVWNSDNEDYTDDFMLLEKRPDEEPPDVIWKKYREYLFEWANAHAGPGFYGMTPACFNEWLGAEYKETLEERDEEPQSD